FDLAATMRDPINLSIGQPDFDVPQPVREALVAAVGQRKNSYSPTQGIGALKEKLHARLQAQYGHKDRAVFVTSGTSRGLVLTMLALVTRGAEVILFDPFFVM